ncbi:N-acetylmuramic acid 6-phosphate etherase, partial [Streptomyces sp. UH6]|nr:N-acetylmuramic acid 6-phosphate etherase [Streptomyces sp. UH6]
MSGADLRVQLESLPTEAARPDLAELDRLPTERIAELMNEGDAAVPAAVAGQVPRIAAA